MTIKKAAPRKRQPSKDPARESLLQKKDIWNAACSDFIMKLIALKRGINGRGDSALNLPPSSITEKLPSEIVGALSKLTSSFQELSSLGVRIVEEQSKFSDLNQKRKQEKSKKANNSYSIVKNSSNSFTRTLSYLKNPLVKSKLKQYRVDFLKSMAVLNKEIEHVEDLILDAKEDSINSASRSLDKLIMDYKVLLNKFWNIKNVLSENEKNKPETFKQYSENLSNKKSLEIETQIEEISIKDIFDKIKDLEDNYKSLNNFISLKLVTALNNLFEKLKSSSIDDKYKISKDILDKYNSLLYSTNEFYNTEESSFKEIADLIKNKLDTDEKSNDGNLEDQSQIQVVAGNLLSRWLKKKRLEYIPNISFVGNNAQMIVDLSNRIDELKKSMDDFMNYLENDFDFDKVEDFLKDISQKLKLTHNFINPLLSSYKNDKFFERLPQEKDLDKSLSKYLERKLLKNITKDF